MNTCMTSSSDMVMHLHRRMTVITDIRAVWVRPLPVKPVKTLQGYLNLVSHLENFLLSQNETEFSVIKRKLSDLWESDCDLPDAQGLKRFIVGLLLGANALPVIHGYKANCDIPVYAYHICGAAVDLIFSGNKLFLGNVNSLRENAYLVDEPTIKKPRDPNPGSNNARLVAMKLGERIYLETNADNWASQMRAVNVAPSRRNAKLKNKEFTASMWTAVPASKVGDPVRYILCVERIK